MEGYLHFAVGLYPLLPAAHDFLAVHHRQGEAELHRLASGIYCGNISRFTLAVGSTVGLSVSPAVTVRHGVAFKRQNYYFFPYYQNLKEKNRII